MRTINPLNLFSPRTPQTATREADEKSQASTNPRRAETVSLKQEEQDETSEKAAADDQGDDVTPDEIDEKSPLLNETTVTTTTQAPRQPHIVKRIATAFIGSIKVVVAAVLAPGQWFIACFYDDSGHLSASMPFRRIARTFAPRKRRKGNAMTNSTSKKSQRGEKDRSSGLAQDTSALTSESELDSDTAAQDSPARNTRSKSPSPSAEGDEASKKTIRIKTVNTEELRRRKQKRAEEQSTGDTSEPPLTVATIKSPTGPTNALRLTKYPRAPAPPRPLIPRRQPSYSRIIPPATNAQKTLIIDLDETLIHSMAKGGRMSTGHMVEVKLSSPVGVGNTVIAPQVPILYYVHKRPHCDEFLKKISRWYNLIVFTASVQEYADPVIDWLELERKYFSARYYRQHCTWRQGAYIKDLSQVEPDLSKVMILDNSPISYIFHEDNAIPIEGWISDPTDNDLLHLIPLLEGLQHATDVRALLALRLGESVS